MENNKLEHLFKNKLDGYTLEPSQATQEKFSRQILYQKRRILLYRAGIAATVVLLLTAGIYALLPGDTMQVDLAVSEPYEIQGELAAPEAMPVPDQEVQTELEKTYFAQQERVNRIADEQEIVTPDVSGLETSDIAEEKAAMLAVEVFKENAATEDFLENAILQEDAIPGSETQLEISGLPEEQREPVKITIEYIASGKGQGPSEPERKNFYSKLDKMKTVDEVIGDIRTYKDRLFALDFNKKETENENSEE